MDPTKQWLVSERKTCTVIIPVADTQPHKIEDIHCECIPEVAIYNTFFKQLCFKPLIIHNSFKEGKFNPKTLSEITIEGS